MKRILSLVIIIVIAVSLISGCADDSVVEINERFFLTKSMHIQRNADEYIGRTVRFEGIFQSFYLPALGGDFFMINRRTWGCCGDDGTIGFQLNLGDIEPLPDNAWAEVYGTFEWFIVEWPEDEAEGREPVPILRVTVETLTELNERGEEFVSQ